jgi:hypothetical protein
MMISLKKKWFSFKGKLFLKSVINDNIYHYCGLISRIWIQVNNLLRLLRCKPGPEGYPLLGNPMTALLLMVIPG